MTRWVIPIGNIDSKKTGSIKVERRPSGAWWIMGRGGDQASKDTNKKQQSRPKDIIEANALSRFHAKWRSSQNEKSKKRFLSISRTSPKAGVRKEPSSKGLKKTVVQSSKPEKKWKLASEQKQSPSVLSRTLSRLAAPLRLVSPPPPPQTTIIAQVPLWLIAASDTLNCIISEYPTTMSILAAVLITVGSIPSLPAVSAGSAAHALGSMAVGVGALLRERAQGITEK